MPADVELSSMLDNSQKPNPILVIRSVMVKRPHCDQQTQKMGIRKKNVIGHK